MLFFMDLVSVVLMMAFMHWLPLYSCFSTTISFNGIYILQCSTFVDVSCLLGRIFCSFIAKAPVLALRYPAVYGFQ
jgi:hypothetical protein